MILRLQGIDFYVEYVLEQSESAKQHMEDRVLNESNQLSNRIVSNINPYDFMQWLTHEVVKANGIVSRGLTFCVYMVVIIPFLL